MTESPSSTSIPYLGIISYMRTRITLDEDVHEFATVYARSRRITLSAAIGELIRKAPKEPPAKSEIRRSADGFPLLPRTGRLITSEMVKELSEEEIG
jgi:hypothetical protein